MTVFGLLDTLVAAFLRIVIYIVKNPPEPGEQELIYCCNGYRHI